MGGILAAPILTAPSTCAARGLAGSLAKTERSRALAVVARPSPADRQIRCNRIAWCLHKTGSLEEAKTAISEALRLGTRDARLYDHAGMISSAFGDRAGAAEYLKVAFDIKPAFDTLGADVAQCVLSSLGARG